MTFLKLFSLLFHYLNTIGPTIHGQHVHAKVQALEEIFPRFLIFLIKFKFFLHFVEFIIALKKKYAREPTIQVLKRGCQRLNFNVTAA